MTNRPNTPEITAAIRRIAEAKARKQQAEQDIDTETRLLGVMQAERDGFHVGDIIELRSVRYQIDYFIGSDGTGAAIYGRRLKLDGTPTKRATHWITYTDSTDAQVVTQ